MKSKYILSALLTASLFTPATVIAENPPESIQDMEINHILNHLKASDCIFIRNGNRYSGEKAADHLAGKYDYARDKIKSAESFIENIASESYFSGKPYQVECPGKPTVKSQDWLTDLLMDYRSG